MQPMRKQLLQNILELEGDIISFKQSLDKYPWDSESELTFLTRGHIKHALNKYLQGDLTNQQLEYWANVIECRDDIGFEEGYEDILEEILFQLANPSLNEPLSNDDIKKIISEN